MKKVIKVKRDRVFEDLSKDCPLQKSYHEKTIPLRCVSSGKPCKPENCGPYHWFRR